MIYNYITFNDSLNTSETGYIQGSYLTENNQLLYDEYLSTDQYFFGNSDDDLIETSIYDPNYNRKCFIRILPQITYSVVEGEYRDYNFELKKYKYKKPITNIAKNNSNILINSQQIITNNIKNASGINYVLYNCIRNIAGDYKYPLVIKEISPSRTELKLTLAFNPSDSEESNLIYTKINAFANRKFLFRNFFDLIINVINTAQFNESFDSCSDKYDINELIYLLGLKNAYSLKEYIENIYYGNDNIILSTTHSDIYNNNDIIENNEFTGICGQLKYFIYSNYTVGLSKDDIVSNIINIIKSVSSSQVSKRTTVTSEKLDVILSFFVNVIYTNSIEERINNILTEYSIRFFSSFKNALNFDNGELVKIINHDSYYNNIDGRYNIKIKLENALPTHFSVKTLCWISNISISPVLLKLNLISEPVSSIKELTGVNYDVNTDISTSNNTSFISSNSENINSLDNAVLNLKNKLNDLLIDYTDFNNFITYSSAELRTKLIKNKIEQYKVYNIAKAKYENAISSASDALKESLLSEIKNIESAQITLLNGLDEYDSYMFFNHFNDSEYIDSRIIDAIEYDKQNKDSLINNIPEYITANSKSNDYTKFTAMIGHFFDNILIYIKKFPKLYSTLKQDFPTTYLDEVLNAYNWKSSNILLQNSNIYAYLFNSKIDNNNTNKISYFEYGKELLNRFVNNLPYIYKTTGTIRAIEALRAIFGIPRELMEIREYGNSDYTVNENLFYQFDRLTYLTKFSGNREYITCYYNNDDYTLNTKTNIKEFTGISTIEFSFAINTNATYKVDNVILLAKHTNEPQIIPEEKFKIFDTWEIKLIKTTRKYMGYIELKIDNGNDENDSIYYLKSKEMPYFNGNLFTIIFTREEIKVDNIPNDAIEQTPFAYKLHVNQYIGDLHAFSDIQSIILGYPYTSIFSKGKYYFGNYPDNSTTNKLNHIKFNGVLDKIKIYKNSLPAEDVEEHSYNIDSISIEDKEHLYENLYYLWSFDTPINLHSNTSDCVKIPNQNTYQANIFPEFEAFNFAPVYTEITHAYPLCNVDYIEKHPFQFEEKILTQALNANGFGPNYKNNLKINKIIQYAESNLTPYDYSTTTDTIIGDDSNVIGFFISPYSYLEKCIENFLGKEGISYIISDPININKSNYNLLNKLSKQFSKLNKRYVYFQEFYTLYKLYIDFSIFDYISKITPGRASIKSGLLIEPSQLERNKYAIRQIVNDTSSFEGSMFFKNLNGENKDCFNSKPVLSCNYINSCNGNIEYTNKITITYNDNYSSVLIPDKIDNRDFIMPIYSGTKSIYCGSDKYNIPTTNLIYTTNETMSYIANNTHNTNSFKISYSKMVEIPASPNMNNSITPNLTPYTGSHYSENHLSKKTLPGSRNSYVAYRIKSTKSELMRSKEKYIYIKGSNDWTTTIDRSGMLKRTDPIISIPGFLTMEQNTNTRPNSGYVENPITSSSDPANEYPSYVHTNLVATMENSSSLNKLIYNL